MPDIDLLLGIIGVEHRGFTHSIVIWSFVFAPLFAKFRMSAIPYFIALAQHILIGDLVVGKTSIFWPLSDLQFGLGLKIFSIENMILEGVGLVAFVAWSILAKEKLQVRKFNAGLLSVSIVIIALFGFLLFISFGGQLASTFMEISNAKHLEHNIDDFLGSDLLVASAIMHLTLIVFLCLLLMLTVINEKRIKKAELRQ